MFRPNQNSAVRGACRGDCACSSQPAPESTAPRAPLYDNLGAYHHPITTDSPDAQKYFDQGLTLSYAFNHAEAIRAFKQAIALDPECAMCFWGVAFALGPNINAPITEDAAKEAFQAIEQARTHAAGAQRTRNAPTSTRSRSDTPPIPRRSGRRSIAPTRMRCERSSSGSRTTSTPPRCSRSR